MQLIKKQTLQYLTINDFSLFWIMKGFCYDIEKKREKKLEKIILRIMQLVILVCFKHSQIFFLEKYGMMLVHLFKVEIV